MGALTEGRKPFADVFTLSCSSPVPFSSDLDCVVTLPPAKKARTTLMPPAQDPPIQSHAFGILISGTQNSTEPPQLLRRVHAPQRNSKFSRILNSDRTSQLEANEVTRKGGVDGMGNILSRYKRAKKSALRTIPWWRQEIVEVEPSDDATCGGLSVDAYKRLVKQQEGHSVVPETEISQDVGQSSEGVRSPVLHMSDVGQSLKFACSPVQHMPSGVSDLTILTPRKDMTEEMEYPSTSNVLGERLSSPPVYKTLLENSRARDSRLSSIDFQLKLNEQKLSAFKLFSRIAKGEAKEDITQELFVPLTKDEEDAVSNALRGSNSRQVLVVHENSNIEITREKIQCLRPGVWLNDEVINLYLELLKERERRYPSKFLNCHFFNTFFYKKLVSGRSGYDYKAVRRWTTQRKIGYSLIECDKIFVPIHKEIHWCLAVINIKDKTFQYLDSLGGQDSQVICALAKYLVDEVKDKSNKEISVHSWNQEFVKNLPEQQNGWDCGVFMIKYVDFYSRGLDLCFSQDDMPYFRRRTAKEILQLKAD